MNEELRIIIRAVTDEAERNMAAIREELENINNASDESGKTTDAAMKGMAKGAAAAVAAITALTAAMVSLGKAAQDVEKGFSKLNTTFLNAGSTTAQASETYKELFSFLGDHDKAIETAQSLALITNSEKELTEWTNILQGAFAEMGDKLPTEGLAEAANETIKTGVVAGVLADALQWLGISEDGFNAALAQTTSLSEREALVRSTLNGLYGNSAQIYEANNQATLRYNESQANLNIALAQAAAYTTPLLTSLNGLSATLLTAMGPALQTVSMYLTAFIQLMAEAIQWVGSFFGMFSSSADTAAADVEGYQAAMNRYMEALRNSFGGTNDNLDETLKGINAVKKATMGFDELNVVSNPASGAGIDVPKPTGGGKIPAAPNPAHYGIGATDMSFKVMLEDIEEAKEKLKGILTLAGIIGIAFLAWKIAPLLGNLTTGIGLLIKFKGNMEKIKGYNDIMGDDASGLMLKLKGIAGKLLVIVGLVMLIAGYSDSWANGVDWGNLALVIGGAAVAVTGLYMAFGPLAASIGAVAAGVAFLVLGVKDFINNGPTMQNTILIIGGAIATAVGLATMGVGPLVAAIIGAVAAVAAFTAAILLEQPAIMSVQEAQENLTAAKERAAEAENTYIGAVDAAEASMKRLEEAEKAAGVTGAELYAQVQAGTLDYANMTAEQKEVYKAYIDNEKKQKDLKASTEELNKAKKEETLASYENQLALAKESGNYDEFKKSVVAAFEAGELSADEARTLIEKSMSEMSDASQKTFMEDLPGDIKEGMNPNKYETTRKKMGDWFASVGKFFTEKIWEPVKKWWNDKVKPIFTKDWWKKKFDAVKEGAKAAFNGVMGVVESAVNSIIKKINTLSWKIPDWVPVIGGGKFGFNFKEIKIPRLATGGIVTESTLANIGERGREAVLPLENNTEWMNVLADRIANRNNTPSRIVLMLDGKELGWATVKSLSDIYEQTGDLPIAIV